MRKAEVTLSSTVKLGGEVGMGWVMMSEREMQRIEVLAQIAVRLGRPPCTLYRELRRNRFTDAELPG